MREHAGWEPPSEISWGPAHEAEWRQLVETLPQIVWITRPDGWHVHYNRQWMDFTGLTLEESLGHGWNPPFHHDDRGRAAAAWQRATTTGEPYEIEYRLRRHDGVYRWMLGRARPLRDETGRIVRWFGTCTDIDDLKQAETQIAQTRTVQRIAGSLAQLGGWAIDLRSRVAVWEPEVFEIIGRDEATDVPLRIDGFLARFPPEHRERLKQALEQCQHDGTPVDLELRLETFEGRSCWVRLRGESHRVAGSPTALVVGALQDISEERRTREELRALNQELHLANTQLEEAAQVKDDLLSMASHELRTPLTPILGFLELLESRGDLTGEQATMVASMRSSGRRMLRLVEDLLVVSRAAAEALASQPRQVAAQEVLDEVVSELGSMLPAVELELDGVEVTVDPEHLRQVATNLVTNAAKYGAPPLRVCAEERGEDRVALVFEDRGPGVPADFQPIMWERFAQPDRGDTRSSMGAGLGLAIVKLLTEVNDGTVGYRDASPAGAVFTVELPGRVLLS